MNRILLVEDDEDLRWSLGEILSAEGYDVIQASSGKTAIEHIECGSKIDLIISDFLMPNGGGKELLRYVREKSKTDPGFIMMTGQSDIQAQEVMALGAQEFVVKPFDIKELLISVRKLIH